MIRKAYNRRRSERGANGIEDNDNSNRGATSSRREKEENDFKEIEPPGPRRPPSELFSHSTRRPTGRQETIPQAGT
jgi:hypothetical protein